MTFGQIDNMNIVANAGSVRRRVIVAEYYELISFTDCYLAY